MASRTIGLLPLPSAAAALAAELARVERELERELPSRARRLFAIERRRVLIRLAYLAGRAGAVVTPNPEGGFTFDFGRSRGGLDIAQREDG